MIFMRCCWLSYFQSSYFFKTKYYNTKRMPDRPEISDNRASNMRLRIIPYPLHHQNPYPFQPAAADPVSYTHLLRQGGKPRDILPDHPAHGSGQYPGVSPGVSSQFFLIQLLGNLQGLDVYKSQPTSVSYYLSLSACGFPVPYRRW